MSEPTVWEKTKKGSKTSFDALWKFADKLAAPVNKLSNKLGSEAFWPTTLDKESDKAARILRSFCKDGFYKEEDVTAVDGPTQKQRVLKKIPQKVIENAVGLCIFTAMRTGLWFSGAGGSGILVAKLNDGSWSPPSGIMLHTMGFGFLAGVDIYDCVIVINDRKALEAFTKVRLTIGGEISAVAGPVGAGGVLDSEVHKRRAPLFTYMKSRGLYGGVQMDGTLIIERTDENERFYGEKIKAEDIVSGKVRHPPYEISRLIETIKSAEGRADANESIIPDEKPPGDYEIEPSTTMFGIPDEEDPDPYGVHALHTEGLEIREAGTRAEPDLEEFEFKPSVTSPVNQVFKARSRQSTLNGRSPSIAEVATMEHITPARFGRSPSIAETSEMGGEENKPAPPKHVLPPMHVPSKVKHVPPPLPSRDKQANIDYKDINLSPSEISPGQSTPFGSTRGMYAPSHVVVSPTTENEDVGKTGMTAISLEDNETEGTLGFHTPDLDEPISPGHRLHGQTSEPAPETNGKPFVSPIASNGTGEEEANEKEIEHGKLPGSFT